MTEISPTIIWACLGIGLIVLEVFTSTFFILFFGLSALIVAVIKLFGLNDLPIELIIFSAIGVTGILFFRKKILTSFESKSEVKIDRGKTITLTEDIASKETGKIKYRGCPWKAFNDSDSDFKKGDLAIISKVDGIKLILKQK